MKKSEILISLVITALIRALIGSGSSNVTFNITIFWNFFVRPWFILFFLFLSLYIFGITLGILVSSGLLRFGPSFENIAWSTMFLWLHLDVFIIQ